MPYPDPMDLLRAIRKTAEGMRSVTLMEVCGTHTVAMARMGLKSLLPPNVKMLSGPGCPVCVTAPGDIDACLALSGRSGVTIATYGDMLRVPGSEKGDSLARRRAEGARVRTVYSPMDAVALAREAPDDKVIFLGAGFETTAPGTAAAMVAARADGLRNFYVYPMLKRLEPAVRALAGEPGFGVDGLLCPGHVASILGAAGFAYVAELGLPGVIAGFEPGDILLGILALLLQIRAGEARVENAYPRAVGQEGNALALQRMERALIACDARWRGLGELPQSGLAPRFRDMDAHRAFDTGFLPPAQETACRCGEVLRGRLAPGACPLFGICTPEDPVGPCMVSSEGACAAAWKYGEM